MTINTIVMLVSLCASVSGIVFAYLAFKRTKEEDSKRSGKSEGVMISDIGYIKACIDRVEKNINKVDDLYRVVTERLVKLEESLRVLEKRVDELSGADNS